MRSNLIICALAVCYGVWAAGVTHARPPKKKTPSAPAKAEDALNASPAVRPGDIVQLPAPLNRVVVGGSGKYLVAFLPTRKQVAVLDVAAKEIVKFIPTDDEDVLVAAGETRLVILQRGKGVISRYKLTSWERELTVACEPCTALAMGSSSEGPLLALGTAAAVLDLTTLKPTELKVNNARWQSGENLLAAANGKVFGCWRDNVSPSGLTVLEIVGDTLQSTSEHTTAGTVNPGPDGRVIYTGLGRYGSDCKPLDNHTRPYATSVLLPAATGPFYLSLSIAGIAGSKGSEPTRLTVHCQNDRAPLMTVTDLTLPDLPNNIHPAHVARLALHRHLFLLPAVDAVVTVPSSLNQFVIQHFNVREELDKGGTDYLFVSSIPPTRLKRGEKLSYPIEVLSKHGGVQYTLETGPDEMTVSPDGLLTWEVPADFAANDVVAMVNIRDSSGQELSHTIKLSEGKPPKAQVGVPRFVPRPPIAQPDVAIARPATPAATPTVPPAATPTVPPAATPTVPPAATPAVSPAVTPIVPPDVRPTAASATPTSVGENQWLWTGPQPICVRDEKGHIGGILSGDKLFLLDADGAPASAPVTLQATYSYVGLRAGQVIAVATKPTRVEILDRSGHELRRVLMENVMPTGFVLHPNKPICYVSLDSVVGELRGAFVVVDEQAATAKAENEQLGQNLEIDPSGRFLVASFFQAFHVGDQIVITPGGAPSNRSRVPSPSPSHGRARGRPQPARPVPGGGGQLGIRHTYANVALALVYDLEDPLRPAWHNVTPLTGMQAGQLRISCDGRRVTSLSRDSSLARYTACDPLNRKMPLVSYELTGQVGPTVQGSDIDHHPLLPISIVAGGGTIRFLDSNDGRPIAGKDAAVIPDFAARFLKRATFSANGRNVVVLANGNVGDHYLVRIPLSLTAAEQTAMQERAAAPPKDFMVRSLPLAEVTALSGGIPKATSPAAIAAGYSDAVVIVRSGPSSGTGFVVGASGLILTCAHCVSPLETVEVVYHPEGKPDEKKTVEAAIVRRDTKTDLALLHIDVEQPLHSVVLADPLDAKSGEDVTIIANPGLGTEVLDNTVTTGIVSNGKRRVEGNEYIQSSAAVNPGSSGGPMFDRNGRVIGVVVLKAGIDGVGFAVPPIPIARFLLKVTRRDGATGQLVRKWADPSMTREVEGRLMGIENGSVTLANTSNDTTKTRPFTVFSVGDQKLLELLSAEQ